MAGMIERFINIFVDSKDATKNLDDLSKGMQKITTDSTKLGEASKKTEKSLRENGGAMGLLSAATGGLSNDFKDAIELTEGLGISLKGLRGAIIATGIGALAIAVLELVTNWDKWKGVIDGSTAALERLNAELLKYSNFKSDEEIRNAEEIINLEELIRKRSAEGASTKEITELENDLSEARKRSADALLYGKGEEKGLFDLRAEYVITLSKLTKGSEKYNETLRQQQENEKAINEQLKIKKAAENDPTVRKAQEERLAREKAIAEALKAQLFVERIRKQLQESTPKGNTYEELMAIVQRSNRESEYLKPYIDSLEKTAQSVITLELELQRLESTLVEFDLDPLNNFVELSTMWDNWLGLDKNLVNINREGSRYAEILDRTNQIFATRSALLEENFNLEKARIDLQLREGKVRLGRISDEITQNDTLLKNEKRQLEAINQKILAKRTLTSEEQANQEKLLKSIQDRIKKSSDLDKEALQVSLANNELKKSIQENESNKSIELSKLEIENFANNEALRTEILSASVDARIIEEERYASSVQALHSNVYSFIDQLQNDQIIKSKDLRNILLVAQKGAQIAEVVINTVRENAKLKMQAGEYATNAALYGGLASSLAAVNPVAAAAYGAAATQYGIAGSKSLATIPINWGIAGASIASIAATTLTSWNRSSGGGGDSSSSGGGGSAQFNIVGSSQSNQLAAQIASQQNQPVNAYVVGTDVTTQQALDRNRITNATFL